MSYWYHKRDKDVMPAYEAEGIFIAHFVRFYSAKNEGKRVFYHVK
jgi:hypothetical protein